MYYTGGYGAYNGMNPYQQQITQNRLNQMEQQYNVNNGFNNYNQQNTMQQQIIKGRPVSSMDEAKASMIDLDGSMFIFPDMANKKIYTKQIMLDGSAEFKTYSMDEQLPINTNAVETQNNSYVLRSDFEQIVTELKNKITMLEGVGNDESDVK